MTLESEASGRSAAIQTVTTGTTGANTAPVLLGPSEQSSPSSIPTSGSRAMAFRCPLFRLLRSIRLLPLAREESWGSYRRAPLTRRSCLVPDNRSPDSIDLSDAVRAEPDGGVRRTVVARLRTSDLRESRKGGGPLLSRSDPLFSIIYNKCNINSIRI